MSVDQNGAAPGLMFVARPDDGMPSRRNKLCLQTNASKSFHEPVRAFGQPLGVLVIRRNAWEPQERIKIFKIIVAHGHKLIGFSTFAYDFRRSWPRIRYTIEASASTIPVTTNSRAVAWARIHRIARIASAGTIFMPTKLKGRAPSARTSRRINTQHAAQQSKYINKTATFESTASFSKVPLIDSANARIA